MDMKMNRIIVLLAALLVAFSAHAAEKLEVGKTTVEYAPCPVTVGTEQPVFGWQIISSKSGTEQKEYRASLL